MNRKGRRCGLGAGAEAVAPVREFVRRLLQDEEDMTATDCEKELKRLLAR
ncbi:hypothetical protein PACILC2_12600 [Paenibacillus cisolokensis]|uniref:Uncharacterized protein n=1 Tax=Paenibacillus cisolokensis TaxID=1658519 RepID=A0ABQ4N3F3_9BACL|nr:hypothetical protein PACILC2_12600 [Paenibacillus cisolokensis]